MTHFYFNIFMLFNKDWVAQKRNIMEFNQFLDDIYGLQFEKQIKALLNSYDIENVKWINTT